MAVSITVTITDAKDIEQLSFALEDVAAQLMEGHIEYSDGSPGTCGTSFKVTTNYN